MIEVPKQTNILHNLYHTTKVLDNYNYVVLYLLLADH